jgi:hypothetical protein
MKKLMFKAGKRELMEKRRERKFECKKLVRILFIYFSDIFILFFSFFVVMFFLKEAKMLGGAITFSILGIIMSVKNHLVIILSGYEIDKIYMEMLLNLLIIAVILFFFYIVF